MDGSSIFSQISEALESLKLSKRPVREPSNQTARHHGEHGQNEGRKEKGWERKMGQEVRQQCKKEDQEERCSFLQDHHLCSQVNEKQRQYRMKPLPRNNFQKFSVIKSLYTNIKEKPLLVWLSRQEMSYISQSQPDSSALWLICGLKINHFVIYNGTFISPPRAVILYHLTSQ